MKIMITAYNQAILKNMYFSGLIDRLIDCGFDVTVSTLTFKKEYFKSVLERKGISVVSLNRVQNKTYFDRVFRRIFITLQYTNYWKYKSYEFKSTSKLRGKFYITLSKFFNLKYFPKFNLIQIFRFFFNKININASIEDWDEIDKIDIVFSTDLFSEEDITIVKMAKLRGKIVISMVRSWDNCYTKGILRYLPNNVFVNNALIKGYLVDEHFCPPDNIHIVGHPQYDEFFNKSTMARDLFLNSIGVDTDKKIVLFLPAGSQLSSTDDDIVEDILSIFKDELVDMDCLLIARNHPGHPANIQERNNCLIMNVGLQFSEGDKFTEFTDNDNILIKNLIANSSAIITVATTFVVDALTFEKFQITISYDGSQNFDYYNSIRRYHDDEHLQDFLNSGASIMASSRDELADALKNAFSNPDYNKKNIIKEKERQMGEFLGVSVDRISNLIVSLSN
jgi:hypothetical protein